MTPDELQQQEELGRKIAAALAPLGLNLKQCQAMTAQINAWFYDSISKTECRKRALIVKDGNWRRLCWSRAAGVAAYFEEQGK